MSTHIPFAKGGDMAKSKVNGAGKYTFREAMFREGMNL